MNKWRVRAASFTEARHHPVDTSASMPMYLTADPSPESVRLNRQNRVVLLFLTAVMLGFTWMPAVLIYDAQPTYQYLAARLFGWPATLATGFALGGASLIPFAWVQYRDPHGPMRKCSSGWAKVGMLLSGTCWMLIGVSSYKMDAGLFTYVVGWHSIISLGFAYVIAESLNNESIIFGYVGEE